MAYTTENYKSKKALREALAAGVEVTCYQPGGMFPCPTDGQISLEGPHYPKPHTWYASGVMEGGKLIKLNK
jgi:hypothetical protein